MYARTYILFHNNALMQVQPYSLEFFSLETASHKHRDFTASTNQSALLSSHGDGDVSEENVTLSHSG